MCRGGGVVLEYFGEVLEEGSGGCCWCLVLVLVGRGWYRVGTVYWYGRCVCIVRGRVYWLVVWGQLVPPRFIFFV